MIGLRESEKKIKKESRTKVKGFKVVIEELKQRISAKSEKLRRYSTGSNQYRQNERFRCNLKALY